MALPRAHRRADPTRAPRFGPRLLAGAVRFQAFAPGARRVEVVLGKRRARLDDVGDGFFAADIDAVGAGTRYWLSRNGAKPLPDPASRWQPLGSRGPSEIVDEPKIARLAATAAHPELDLGSGAVLYEIHVGSFSARGDYDGVRRKLDHLVSLGVDAIKLMPLATFPGARGWGYDGVFHFAPHPSYGTPQALARLTRACHQRGLGVLLDVVTNHFGPEHNAMWGLAQAFFEPDLPTPWASGINFAVEAVMRYFDEMARYWLGVYDFDGLRLDAFNAIPAGAREQHLERLIDEVDALRPASSRRRTLLWLESSSNQHAPLGARGENGCVDVAQLNFDVHHASHVLLTGERHGFYEPFDRPMARLARCLSRGFAFPVDRRGASHGWSVFINYLENHDTCGNRFLGERHASLADARAVRALLALVALHPSPLYLFQGQEWQSERPFFFFTDFDSAFGKRVTRARLRGFDECDPRVCGPAPGPQDEEAFDASTLDWSEPRRARGRHALAFTRELLATRRRFVHLMSHSGGVAVRRRGRLLVLEIAPRRGNRPFVVLANLDDHPVKRPETARGRRLYRHSAEAPVRAQLAGWTIELWR